MIPKHNRLVCLAINSDEAQRVAHLLRALSDDRYWYSVCVAEPDEADGDPLSLVETDTSNHTA